MKSTPISRRAFSLLAAAAVAAPALRAQGSKAEKHRVSIAVGGKAAFYHLPLTIAEQLGYFKAEGVDVEVSDHPGADKALQALIGGAADVVSGAYEHTIHLQARNHAMQAFVLMGRAPQIAMGVSMKALPNYRSVADLRGKKIGVPAAGGSTSIVSNLVLSRAGIRSNEVSYVDVGASAGALIAVRSGQVEAICGHDPVMTMLEQKGEVRIIGDTRTLKGTQEVFGGPMPAACLCANAAFIRNHPVTCQGLANAVVHALKWLQTAGPSDIIKTVPENYLLGDRALYLASFNKLREALALDGVLPEDGARVALKALASFDASIRADRIDLARTYTNDFALRAKEKFKA